MQLQQMLTKNKKQYQKLNKVNKILPVLVLFAFLPYSTNKQKYMEKNKLQYKFGYSFHFTL